MPDRRSMFPLIFACFLSSCTPSAPAYDLAIMGGDILTADADNRIIHDGVILLKDGIIRYVGSKEDSPSAGAGEVVDAEGMIICPGWINAHCHAAMTMFRGMADDLPLEEWLTKQIWPAEARFVTPVNVKTGAELAILEMLSHGVTTFSDMYFFEEELAKLADSLGIRVLLGEGIASFPTPSAESVSKSFELVIKQVDTWSASPYVHVSVAPHSPYTVEEPDLLRSDSLAKALNLPLQIHVSETRREVETSTQSFGRSPVKRLAELGLLRKGTIIAHCVHPDEDDMKILEESGAGIVHCPQSNLKLGSGIAPVTAFLQHGIPVGTGTDGAASNNDLDLKDELLTGALLQKGILQDPAALTAEDWFRIGTIEGASVLGLDSITGSLEAGKYADILFYRTDALSSTPMYDPVSHLLYVLDSRDLDAVMVQGNWKMKNGQLLVGDSREIRRKARNLATKIKDSLYSMYQ